MQQFIRLHQDIVAVSIMILINTIFLLLTVYYGRLNRYTTFHLKQHRFFAWAFTISVIVTGVVVEKFRPDDDNPVNILTWIHLVLTVVPFCIILGLLIFKRWNPDRIGNRHYTAGWVCFFLFLAVMITGYLVHFTKS